ncbi:2OG-Fe(II) oxygenase family protein, putative [Eimeria brunetti]|uniref:2OG-Fe(II) oxygenase family protein, putative n=1 Tax=Eimeria brunetti TaxID=51314 RepID=U6LXJ2_9EIME|nr:2OG-Fe(II) oxygenase family protein, putative [Eimeria brunetti]
MDFAARPTQGLSPGCKVEGQLDLESAYPAYLGENDSSSEGNNEFSQPQGRSAPTGEMLPIGEAVPEGEHLRTLRVYSKSLPPAPAGTPSGGAPPQATSAVGILSNDGGEGAAGSYRECREVQVLRVFRNPDVMIAPNLITKEHCLHLLKLADGKWTRSKTSIGKTSAPQAAYKTTESQTRTSYSVMLEEAQTPGVESVELLACALAQLPLQHLESLVLVRYAEGEYFAEHHDGGFRPKTVLLYLNDVEDGGYTHFTRLGLKIGPSQGSGALWSNVTPRGEMDFRTVHAGVAPTKGTKYVVNCFFNETVVRHAKPPAPLSLEPPHGIQNPEEQWRGVVSSPSPQMEKNAAKRNVTNAYGQFPSNVEPAKPHQPQQQHQRDTTQNGESLHRLIWGVRDTEAHGGRGGVANLPIPPLKLPSTATACPPTRWLTRAAGGVPLDRRWM